MTDRPPVRVCSERDRDRGWVFRVRLGAEGAPREVEVRLAWADYEHWSRGRLTPSEVVRAVLECAADALGADGVPEACDAATLRRLTPGFDRALGGYLPR